MSYTIQKEKESVQFCCCQEEKSLMRSDAQWQENRQAIANRLSRAIGHLEAVKEMLEQGRDCAHVLIQLAAVRSAVNNAGKVLLQNHIQHCVVRAVETHDQQVLEDLSKAIDQFLR